MRRKLTDEERKVREAERRMKIRVQHTLWRERNPEKYREAKRREYQRRKDKGMLRQQNIKHRERTLKKLLALMESNPEAKYTSDWITNIEALHIMYAKKPHNYVAFKQILATRGGRECKTYCNDSKRNSKKLFWREDVQFIVACWNGYEKPRNDGKSSAHAMLDDFPNDKNHYVTISQAAKRTCTKITRIKQWVKDYSIPAYFIKGKVRILYVALEHVMLLRPWTSVSREGRLRRQYPETLVAKFSGALSAPPFPHDVLPAAGDVDLLGRSLVYRPELAHL